MLDQELSAPGFEVWVTCEARRTLDEGVVSGGRVGVCSRTCVVQRCENTRGSAFLDEIAYDLVVEVLDRRPLDLLANVLFLFGLEGEFNEDLLELLVDVIDAKLLKGVVLSSVSCENEAEG